MGLGNDVCVYTLDGQLQLELSTGSDVWQQRSNWDVAWSSQGNIIYLWRGSNVPADLNVFDCTIPGLTAHFPVPGLNSIPFMPRVLSLFIVHIRECSWPYFLADVQRIA